MAPETATDRTALELQRTAHPIIGSSGDYDELLSRIGMVFHFDETRALEPLEIDPEWRAEEPPENVSDRNLSGPGKARGKTRETKDERGNRKA